MNAIATDVSRLWLVVIGLVSYLFTRTIYRLYFHPLSSIPGPKLTAATHLFEFYHTIIRPGMFLFEIEKMHKEYGPIVRINPREIHVNDPAFYNQIYAPSTRKRDKDPKFVTCFGSPDSMIATVGHDHHRFRRNILNNFFSKASVLKTSDVFEERLAKLSQRLKEFQKKDSVVRLHDLFSALTSDVLCAYACGRHWGFLDDPDFRNDVRNAITEGMDVVHYTRFFPFLAKFTHIFSMQVISILLPQRSALFQFLGSLFDYATAASKQEDQLSKINHSPVARKNMIQAMADPGIPPGERSEFRLRDELTVLMAAGTETTTTALVLAAYQLGRNTVIRDKLRAELKEIMPSPESRPTWPELERLPYLSAFINEVLRLSYGVVSRLPRVAPMETLQYKHYTIPPGTPMSSSSYLMHRNPETFPDPETFDPDRWIKAAQNGQPLARYLVSFTKGSRGCIGINFAHMELFVVIAHVARWFNVHLHDTGPEDVRITGEMFVPITRRGPVKGYAKTTS